MSLEKLMEWIEKLIKESEEEAKTLFNMRRSLYYRNVRDKIKELAREELKEVKKSLLPVFDSGQALIYLNEKKEELEKILK